ncbi:hypothetical protein PM082_017293 [Marasmius tenuissimus]|nr:hypothetical protein PM082_017293 [Marasmius tenuissimus]
MQLSQAHPLPPSLHQFQQQAQQALASVAADHDLKRRYLALLPPQQIIDICLTFDLHVPPYIKSTVWPLDLNAAIGSMQEKEGSRQGTPGQTEEKKDAVPLMDSLFSELENTREGESSNNHPPQPQEKSPPPPPPPPTAATATNEVAPVPQPPPAAASPAPTATSSTPTPVPTPAPAPPPQGRPPIGYPHQPYGYPHSPYYPQQWGTYPIRFPPFPGLPFPPFPGPPPPPGAPGAPGAPVALSSANPPAPVPPPQVQVPLPVPPPPPPVPPAPDPSSQDDLPSYEDMIVQVLSTLPEDSEGLVPKDLWSWMASRYPLQSNFRPSAGQALGKAYKKGRLEKSDSGRYRLNPEWKGEGTTRKGTRRPQLQPPSASTPGSGAGANSSGQRPPPFTNTPLIRGGSVPGQFTAPNGQPLTMFGYGGFHPPPTAQKTVSTHNNINGAGQGSGGTGTGDSGDAFEAAQHILKALNFGALLTMDGEDANAGEGESDRNAGAGTSDITDNDLPIPVDTGTGDSFDENIRAELQAQLALLAVQLGEILQEPDLDEVDDVTVQAQGYHQESDGDPRPSTH